MKFVLHFEVVLQPLEYSSSLLIKITVKCFTIFSCLSSSYSERYCHPITHMIIHMTMQYPSARVIIYHFYVLKIARKEIHNITSMYFGIGSYQERLSMEVCSVQILFTAQTYKVPCSSCPVPSNQTL